ncbi:glycosyltransferase family 4 protein [uncultured Massilia sp.]|uniref:glycosyltransferase family 4 protein n=1 Tax=uncultured Massilia sp. TaxID=169973 RepID=UPI0025EB378B|nr:glycosyltransferase family 4 protein [uncultured Massilia sp.]
MTRVLFIHQNLPGQFRRLIRYLQTRSDFDLVAIGEETAVRREHPGPRVRVIGYPVPDGAGEKTHHYLKHFEACVRRGQSVARVCVELQKQGWTPDVVVCHPGWGEALFVKDVFPQARLVVFCEFWWSAEGSDVGFDPEYPASFDDRLRLRIKNSVLMQSLLAADDGVAPTRWQRDVHPPELRGKIREIHEGIDTTLLGPDPQARLALPDGRVLTRAQPVLTYVARNLEPYRGFHVFMRSLPRLLAGNPALQVVVIGGDGVSYGRKPPQGFDGYRAALVDELDKAGTQVDWSRVHFLGKVPYGVYRSALQVASLHVYLTYPFVLSWSMLEAMASGTPVLASDTAPVREVIRDGENGFLVPFFDVEAWAARVLDLVARRDEIAAVGMAGRATVQRRFDFGTVGLPAYLELLTPLARPQPRAAA